VAASWMSIRTGDSCPDSPVAGVCSVLSRTIQSTQLAWWVLLVHDPVFSCY
jgi:hypothetical protein